jgi:beta-glucanase (GH16 family)
MIPHYIKASDEATLWNALEAAGLATKQYDPEDPANIAPEGAEDFTPSGEFDWVKADGYDLDIIGVIYKPTEEVDEEGNPVMEQLDGYHANIRKWDGDFTEEQLAALPLIVPPNKPVRIWAGD